MSNTPETDAEAWIETDRANAVVFAKFARKLERERDEARTTIEDAKRALNATAYEGILLAAMRAKEERDEARESLKHITEYGTEEINAAVELRQKLATALVERDEAREELNDIRLNLGKDADGYTLIHAVCVLQNERDELLEKLSTTQTQIQKNQ